MTIAFFLIAGLVLLFFGAELLVKSASAIALKLGLPPLVIGLTVVAFGTSMPEMTVSVQAAMNGAGDIAAANVVGSNIFNIALILGLAAAICPIRITAQIVRVDIPIMIGVSVLCIGALRDRQLSRFEGLALLFGIIAYTVFSFRLAKKKPFAEATQEAEEMLRDQRPGLLSKSLAWAAAGVIAGLALLVLGSKALIAGATELALMFGVSQAVIGLTIVSAGTSLPELATSVIAALRRQPDISVGNVVGSNIFNVLGILGCSSLLNPYSASGVTTADLLMMLGTAVLSLPLMWSRFTLSRAEGVFLLACYGGYLWYLWPK